MKLEDEIIQHPEIYSVSPIDHDPRCGRLGDDSKKANLEEIALLDSTKARVAAFKNSVIERHSIGQAMETVVALSTTLDACMKMLPDCKRYEDLPACIEALKKEGK